LLAKDCKIILVGDKNQLSPVNNCSIWNYLFEYSDNSSIKSCVVNLEKTYRNIGDIALISSLIFNNNCSLLNQKIKQLEKDNNSKEIPFNIERFWQAEHEHDDEVTSIAIERFGDVDPEKLNTWLGRLLSEKGVDIFRTKGFISYSGNPQRIVFQGVHMLFTAQPDKEWGNEPRRNQLVFIGRNLDEKEMKEGFEKCLI